MKAKGFTLIELMIVVAIIAIIAAVAIPNLLRSRIAANETAAAAACKTISTGQETYRRTDWEKDGFLEYATTLGQGKEANGPNLYYDGAKVVNFVDRALSAAEYQGGTGTPKAGYLFEILTNQTTPSVSYLNANNSAKMTNGHAVMAVPSEYDGTGRNSFQMSYTGTIYQKDTGNGDTLASFEANDSARSWTATE